MRPRSIPVFRKEVYLEIKSDEDGRRTRRQWVRRWSA